MYDNTTIPAKIEQLGSIVKDNPEALKRLREWTNKLKSLDGFASYAENPITLYMIGKAMQIVKDSRALLATNRKLSELDRERLFERIDAHLWYVDMFDTNRIEREMEGIGRSIDSELEAYEPPASEEKYKRPQLNEEENETTAVVHEIAVEVDYPTRDGVKSSIFLGPDVDKM